MPRQGATGGGRYRMATEGQPTQRGNFGMYVLEDNAGCQVYRPSWNATRTIFRPFPGKNPENHAEWDPFRLSDEERDYGDWIRRYDMAMSFGEPGITFIMKNPADDTLNDQQNPVWMLHRAITAAVKAGQGQQSWNPLIFGAAGRGAPISAPKDGYVMQGILMEHKSKPENPPRGCLMEHKPVVLLMSQSAGAALLERLNEKDVDGNWAHPDITDLTAGMFVQFHQAGTQNQAQGAGAPQMMGQSAAGGGDIGAKNSYEVVFNPMYNGIAPSFPDIQELAAAHTKPWDEIIRVPTIEDQVKMLCGCIPASAITYALGDVYRDMIPQHIWDQSRAQTQTNSTPFANAQASAPAAANPMAQSQPANPMGQAPANPVAYEPPAAPPQAAAPAANPMAAPPQAAPPAEPVQTTVAPPQAAAPAAPPQEFDTQPTTAEPSRAADTMGAIERARQRVAKAAGGS